MHVKEKEHLSPAGFYSVLCLFLPPELEGVRLDFPPKCFISSIQEEQAEKSEGSRVC